MLDRHSQEDSSLVVRLLYGGFGEAGLSSYFRQHVSDNGRTKSLKSGQLLNSFADSRSHIIQCTIQVVPIRASDRLPIGWERLQLAKRLSMPVNITKNDGDHFRLTSRMSL